MITTSHPVPENTPASLSFAQALCNRLIEQYIAEIAKEEEENKKRYPEYMI